MQRSENFSLGLQGTTTLSREDSHAKLSTLQARQSKCCNRYQEVCNEHTKEEAVTVGVWGNPG